MKTKTYEIGEDIVIKYNKKHEELSINDKKIGKEAMFTMSVFPSVYRRGRRPGQTFVTRKRRRISLSLRWRMTCFGDYWIQVCRSEEMVR